MHCYFHVLLSVLHTCSLSILRRSMNYKKLLEENLREAACFGDLETLRELILKGVDVNSKNQVNGWTALHWAARRNNCQAVSILLNNGADINCTTHSGDLPCNLTSCEKVLNLLGGKNSSCKSVPVSSFVPNYIKNPPILCSSVRESEVRSDDSQERNCSEALILKLRVADSSDQDFIEIELPKSELFFEKLKNVCCNELNIEPNAVLKLRKLPNTIIRNDKDVQRLKEYEELEIVKLKA